MKYYINYADFSFVKQQKIANKFAKKYGGFDEINSYSKGDIDVKFREKYKHILHHQKGGGFWLWKSYIICKKLLEVEYGDYVFYSDSGSIFLKSVDLLVVELERAGQDIMAFELPVIESQWTKKELFDNMECDTSKYRDSNMIMAGFHLIKKTEFSVSFYQEFLRLSCNEVNITDYFYTEVIQNNDFIEHRHDQSIFSLLYKKHKLRPFKDATQFGQFPASYGGVYKETLEPGKLYLLSNGRKLRIREYQEQYLNILYLFRSERPYYALIKFNIKRLLYRLGLYNGMVS